jgi:serine/threonine protein kinase
LADAGWCAQSQTTVTTDPDTEKPPAFQIDDTLSRRTISQLTHPHICTVYDVGEQPGTAFLVMEYLEGHSLNDWLERNPLPFDQAFTIASENCRRTVRGIEPVSSTAM